jgi:hypothetical protein
MAAYTETGRRKGGALNLPVIRTRNDLRREPQLPVMRASLEGVREVAGAPGANGDIPSRPPAADERLTGEGGAELGARDVMPSRNGLPTISPEALLRLAQQQGVASGALGGPGGAAMGEPPAAPPGYSEGPASSHYRELLEDDDPDDTNGRGRSGARMALHTMGRAAESGSVGYTVGAGLGGLLTGLIDKDADEEQIDRPRDLARAKAAADAESVAGEQRRKQEAHAADVDYKKSAADWNRQRPEFHQAKAAQDSVKYEISNRLKDPRPFDPNDDNDVNLLGRARSLGIHLSPGSFGDHKNPFTIEILDPADPSNIRKTRLSFDRASGTWSPVTDGAGAPVVTNRVQPVGDDGRTPNQREADGDRDRAFDAQQDYRARMFGLSSERLREQMLNGLSTRAGREFTTATRGLFERRREVEKQIEDYSKRAAALSVDPAEARRRIGGLEEERDRLTSQIDGARSSALGAMSSSPAPARGSQSSPPGRPDAPAGRVSRKNFDRVRAQNPSLQGKSDAEVEAALRARGIEVY